jgi:hypothetical protein
VVDAVPPLGAATAPTAPPAVPPTAPVAPPAAEIEDMMESAPAAASPPVPPEDALLPFAKGQFEGKKLSDLDAPMFHALINGYRNAMASEKIAQERKEVHREWLKRAEAWAAYRGVAVP